MQDLLKPILSVIFLVVGYFVGFFPVVIGSLGTIEPGPLIDLHRQANQMNWWHCTYSKDGQTYLTAGWVAVVGWLILGGLFGAIWSVLKLLGV